MGNCIACGGASLPSLKEDYRMLKRLGSGYEGQVVLCQEVQTSQLVAVKLMPLNLTKNKEKKMFSSKMEVLAALSRGHVNIVQTRELFVTKEHLGFVMEYVKGGSLDQYCRRNKMTEDTARYFFRQIISAVEFIHKHHIAHRDLKLQNIMLDDHDPPRVKLCDFGLSKLWTGPRGELTRLKTFAGTPGYISPEMLKKVANKASAENTYDGAKTDVFACGVVLVVMLLHHHPYQFSKYQFLSLKEMLASVYKTQVTSTWNASETLAKASSQLSPECVDLLSSMLQANEAMRITVPQIMQHPWFKAPVRPGHQRVLDDLAKKQVDLEAALSPAEVQGGYQRLRSSLQQLQQTASQVSADASSPSGGSSVGVGVLMRVALLSDALWKTASPLNTPNLSPIHSMDPSYDPITGHQLTPVHSMPGTPVASAPGTPVASHHGTPTQSRPGTPPRSEVQQSQGGLSQQQMQQQSQGAMSPQQMQQQIQALLLQSHQNMQAQAQLAQSPSQIRNQPPTGQGQMQGQGQSPSPPMQHAPASPNQINVQMR